MGSINITIGRAIDMLIEDESLRFSSGGIELYKDKCHRIVVSNVYEGKLYPALNNPYIGSYWSLASSPINFLEASQSGSKIKVRHKIINVKVFSGYYNLRYLMEKLSKNHSTADIREILRNGEFYIK